MTARPKFGTVAICDAAYRDSQSGKAIIAGMYTGEMLVPSFPAAVQVAFYIEILNCDRIDPAITFEVIINGNTAGKAPVEISNPGKEPAVVILPAIPLLFDKPGHVALRARWGDDNVMTAIRKKIRTSP